MEFEVIDVTKADKKPHISIYVYDAKGNKHRIVVTDFLPRFYILLEEEVPADRRIVRINHGNFQSIFGEKLKQVLVQNTMDVVSLRKWFKKTYEDDVPFHWVFRHELKIKTGIEIPNELCNNGVPPKHLSHKKIKGV